MFEPIIDLILGLGTVFVPIIAFAIRRLRKELENTIKQAEDANQRAHSLRVDLEAEKDGHRDTKRDLRDFEAKLDTEIEARQASETRNGLLKEQVDTLYTRLGDIEKNFIAQAENQKREFEAINNALLEKVKELEGKLEANEKRYRKRETEFKQQYLKQKRQLANKESKIRSLQSENDQLTNDNKALLKRIEEQADRIDKLTDTVTTMQTQMNILTSQVNRLLEVKETESKDSN